MLIRRFCRIRKKNILSQAARSRDRVIFSNLTDPIAAKEERCENPVRNLLLING